jgi:hypothetical protein
MASPNFVFVTTEESENCRTASAEAATTASLPVTCAACKPSSKFSAPVGVVSQLKKKNESLANCSHVCTLQNAPVTIPVFAIGCVPTKITVIYVFADYYKLQASHSGILSSSSASSQHSGFSATSASDFTIGRMVSTIHHLKAWQELMQPRINDAMEWKREIGLLLAELVAHQRDSELSIKAIIPELQLLRSNLTGVADLRQATPSETLGGLQTQDPWCCLITDDYKFNNAIASR